MKKNKGFTLIELLVVISIIGILAVIVLTSLDSAGQKGANAGIKSNATSIKSQAQIYWVGQNQSYENFCSETAGDAISNASLNQAKETAKTTGNILRDGATAQSGTAESEDATLYCNSSIRSYVVSLPLRTVESRDGVDANFWCIDSKGFVGGIANPIDAGGTSCADQITTP